jgi:hypothetical protein
MQDDNFMLACAQARIQESRHECVCSVIWTVQVVQSSIVLQLHLALYHSGVGGGTVAQGLWPIIKMLGDYNFATAELRREHSAVQLPAECCTKLAVSWQGMEYMSLMQIPVSEGNDRYAGT